MVVGVLALQGDFADHQEAMERLGLATRQVRSADQLAGLDGLVLPGGESTTMLRLLHVEGLFDPLRAAIAAGLPTLATCAGLILVAAAVENPRQSCYGLLDVTVRRNGYGRQCHSGTFPIQGPGVPAGATGVFIRAPRITAIGPKVEVLARRDADPVLVRQGTILGCCFHPELCERHPALDTFVAGLER